MESVLEKKSISLYENVFSDTVSREESTEIIVPDVSWDIEKIVTGTGCVFIKSTSARENKIEIEGSIKGSVLYIAEGDSRVRSLPVFIPFAYSVDAGNVRTVSHVSCTASVRSADVREVNPRKVAFRMSADFVINAYDEKSYEVCCDIQNAEECAIELSKESADVYFPACVKAKSFAISDDIELSGASANLAEMLANEVSLSLGDMKIIGNKAIVKGNADIKYMCNLKDGSLAASEHEIPFSQIIDIDGAGDDYDLRVSLSCRGADLEPQYDASGEARYISVNILCDACAVAYYRGEIENVADVYSTKYNLTERKEKVPCMGFSEHISKRVSVNETMETTLPVKNVTDVSVKLFPPVRRREEGGEVLTNDGYVSVIYTAEDGSISSAKTKVRAVCPLPLKESCNYLSDVSVAGKAYSLGGEKEINVRFFADYEITEVEAKEIAAISMLEADTENPIDTAKIPSVTVKRMEGDSSLWELAKRYRTTVSELSLANEVSEDVLLKRGDMVLIPKKR